MDIFAAQLKRVTKVPIRKQRLKIDALNKGSASKGLTDDLDHLENHEQYFELPESNDEEKPSQKTKSSKDNENDESSKAPAVEQNTSTENEYEDVQVIPEFLPYAKKARIPREELKQLEEAKKSLKHLDLFI